jgi:phosphonate transport system substrate-binding protein
MQLREALIAMPSDRRGSDVLAMLRLDGFSNESPELFDGIARKMDLVRGVPP